MCEGGRIKHHLRYNISRPECAVVFVGFQAAGTLGRRIVDGATSIRLFGDEYPVKARVFTIGGLSAHADQTSRAAASRMHGGGRFLVDAPPGSNPCTAADYFRWLFTCFVISNIETRDLPPKTFFSLSSALIVRRSFGSWRLFFLM